MITFTQNGREGALRKFQITGATREQFEAIKEVCDYGTWFKDGIIDGQTNKSNFSDVEAFANSLNVIKSTKAQTTTGRRIELVSEAQNMNHGKSWAATLRNVDQHSLHPSWEGQKICYVYN